MPNSRRPLSFEPSASKPKTPLREEKKPLVTIEERRAEREKEWSSHVNRYTEDDFRKLTSPLSPTEKNVINQEILAAMHPSLIEKKFLEPYSANVLTEIMRDPKLSYQRLVDHVYYLEERLERGKDNQNHESKQFAWLMYLVPIMKEAVFRGTITAIFSQRLKEAGIAFKPEWIREFVQKAVNEPVNEKTAHVLLKQLNTTGWLRAVGEFAIRKSAEQKEGAHRAFHPTVRREVFAQRSRVYSEIKKMNARFAALGMSVKEQRPFLRQLRSAILRNDTILIEQIQSDVREQARENMINKLDALGLNARPLFQQAGVNSETAAGLQRLTKIASLFNKVSRNRKMVIIRRQLVRWRPETIDSQTKQSPQKPSVRKSSISIRGMLSERGTTSTPAERLSVMNSRLRENKISNKQRVQLIERMMLTTIRIPEYNNGGIIDISTLAINAARKSYPDLFSKALQNLIRKNKFMKVNNNQYRLVQ